MALQCSFLWLLLFWVCLIQNTVGVIWSGTFRSVGSWSFIDRFVHVATPEDKVLSESYGLLKYEITHPVNMKITLMVYHLDFTDWKRIYRSSASDRYCDDMIKSSSHYRYLWADTEDFQMLGIQNFDIDGLVDYSEYDPDVTFGAGKDADFAVAYDEWLSGLEKMQSNRSKWFRRVGVNETSVPPQGNGSISWPAVFVDTSNIDGIGTVTYNGTYAFASEVPTWSFVAIANCDMLCFRNGSRFCQNSLDQVHYRFELTNGQSHNRKHFSYDEIGIMDTQITLFCLLSMVGLYGLWVRRKLLSKQKFHHTVRILLYSIFLNWFSLIMGMGYYGTLAWRGTAEQGAAQAERIFFAMSDTLLVLLLILIAKGWTIVRPKISISGRVKIAIFMTCYFLVAVIGAVWRDGFLDKATSIYVYETDPGILLIVMRLLAAAWFQYAAYTTHKNFREKRSFYRVFNSVFLVWLLYVPFTALVVLGLPETEMEKSAYIMEKIFYFCGQVVLITLYNPDGIMKRSFPFHANQNALKEAPKRAIAQNNTMQVINAKGQATGITGGTTTSNVSDKIVLMDSFEQMHMKRLKQISDHIELKLVRLNAVSKTMQQALSKVHVPDENDIDDGWGPRTQAFPRPGRQQDRKFEGITMGGTLRGPRRNSFQGRRGEREMTDLALARQNSGGTPSFREQRDMHEAKAEYPENRSRSAPRPGYRGLGRGGGRMRSAQGGGRGGRGPSPQNRESPPPPRRTQSRPDDDFDDPPSPGRRDDSD
mmetsp:Transcript_28941/g.38033  ORF Transcript_28941/g.38033 Transcript_28941/m.38033 type:complete len:761 (-) Transcript_28941:161-2443(-)